MKPHDVRDEDRLQALAFFGGCASTVIALSIVAIIFAMAFLVYYYPEMSVEDRSALGLITILAINIAWNSFEMREARKLYVSQIEALISHVEKQRGEDLRDLESRVNDLLVQQQRLLRQVEELERRKGFLSRLRR